MPPARYLPDRMGVSGRIQKGKERNGMGVEAGGEEALGTVFVLRVLKKEDPPPRFSLARLHFRLLRLPTSLHHFLSAPPPHDLPQAAAAYVS